MKTNLFISAIATILFFTASCKKEQDTTVNSKTINVSLKQNESYSYSIPSAVNGNGAMEISQQAQHASTSKISTDAARNTLFEYIPALDYTGTDEIHVSTVSNGHKDGHNGDHHNGNCQGHGNETETNYIFKINVTANSVTQAH